MKVYRSLRRRLSFIKVSDDAVLYLVVCQSEYGKGTLRRVNYGSVVASYWFYNGAWSDDDKLTAVVFSANTDQSSGTMALYSYGADGLRKASWPGTWNGTTRHYDAGAKTFYVYAGGALIGEIAANGTPTAAYTWGAAGLVSEWHWSTGLNLFYHYGPQGETRTLTDASGAVRDTYVYTPYGYPVTSTGTDANPFQFGGSVGYYSDPLAQGLVLCGQRWYSPGWARWLSRDPIGYDGGADLYGYCGGNPVGSLDPDGLTASRVSGASQPLPWWDIIGNVVGGAKIIYNELKEPWDPQTIQLSMMVATDGLGGIVSECAGGFKLTSIIKNDPALIRAAEEAGRSVQPSIDSLTKQLARGNLNPGIGTKNLFGEIFYARARDGARVFFRHVGKDGIEILAKAHKGNEQSVINVLSKLYGK